MDKPPEIMALEEIADFGKCTCTHRNLGLKFVYDYAPLHEHFSGCHRRKAMLAVLTWAYTYYNPR